MQKEHLHKSNYYDIYSIGIIKLPNMASKTIKCMQISLDKYILKTLDYSHILSDP